MWSINKYARFSKQYKNQESKVRSMIDKALEDMARSADPAELGVYKQSMRVFAYEIGRKYRIIYSVEYEDKVIKMLRVCDHKSTFGRD